MNNLFNKKNIVFTHHALKRARERKLWKYVNKEKFFFDAIHNLYNTAKLDNCIFAYKNEDNKTIITTMWDDSLRVK